MKKHDFTNTLTTIFAAAGAAVVMATEEVSNKAKIQRKIDDINTDTTTISTAFKHNVERHRMFNRTNIRIMSKLITIENRFDSIVKSIRDITDITNNNVYLNSDEIGEQLGLLEELHKELIAQYKLLDKYN